MLEVNSAKGMEVIAALKHLSLTKITAIHISVLREQADQL